MDSIRLCAAAEVPPGSVREVVVNGHEFVVCNIGGEMRVLDNRCPHVGGPLGQGNLVNGMVVCPWHAWAFDTKTGECDFNSCLAIRRYQARVVDGTVFVER